MIPLGPVVARTQARVDRAVVWEYLVDDELRRAWWPELRLDPRVGGEVTERWTEASGDSEVSRDASGEIDVWVDGHAFGFRWSEAGDGQSTAVLVTLRASGPDTKITVTETGFDALPTPAESAAASQEGWQVLLSDLVATVEAAVGASVSASEVAEVAEVAEGEGSASASADMTDAEESEDQPESVDPENQADPIEPTEPTESTESTESTDPTDPTGPTESTEPTDPTDPTDLTESTDPTEPTEPTEPEDPEDPDEPGFDELMRGPQAH